MMSVNRVNAAGAPQTGAGNALQNDSVSKSIQNQIRNAQKQLQELGADKNLTPEEKTKRRQEIQQEITNLNQQLQQRQMEKRKEEQARRAAEREAGQNNRKEQAAGDSAQISSAGMKAMLSADASLKQAKVQENVAARMEGRAGVLKAEIKQDAGQDTSAKEAQLAEAEQKAQAAEAAQMKNLAQASRTLTEAAQAGTDRTEAQEADAAKADAPKTDGTGAAETNGTDAAVEADAHRTAETNQIGKATDEASKTDANPNADEFSMDAKQSPTRKRVDIRL